MRGIKKSISVLLVFLLSISLVSCVSSKKAAIANVNGEKITKEEFNYFLTSVKEQIKSEQGSDITDDFWETAEVEGKKAIETAKEKALEEAVKTRLARQKAIETGVKITSKQREEINSKIGQFITKYGKDGVDDYLKQYGLNQELFKKVLEDSAYKQTLTEQLTTDVDEAYAKNYFNTKIVRVKHVLFMTVNTQTNESLPAEQVEAAKIKADEVLAKAKAGEDFDALVKQYSEDPGSQQSPDGYYLGKGFALGSQGGMVPAFETASLELAVGGVSDIVESNYGYHIIKRYENVESKYTESPDEIMTHAKAGRFDELLETWKSEAKIEKNEKEYNLIK